MRRKTIEVSIGPVTIGGANPVAVQSMTDTDTGDIAGSLGQITRLREAGCRIVRLTVQGAREVESMREISKIVRAQYPDVALVADVHFSPEVALSLAGVVDKVRINPGNYGDPRGEKFTELVDKCRETKTAIRIGVNHGSIEGDMVAGAMAFLRVCRQRDFDQVVVSIKSSDVREMATAYLDLTKAMDGEDMHFPLHLGVTEAGNGLEGRVKSAVGIGTLLTQGLGDTIRVSLTEPPENEIPVAQAILQACGLDHSRAEFIACPGCGRTLYDLGPVLEQIKAATGHLAGLKIGVMGCIVNGPGEMRGADYGYVGASPGHVTLYRGGEAVRKNIPQQKALEELVELLKADGVWRGK